MSGCASQKAESKLRELNFNVENWNQIHQPKLFSYYSLVLSAHYFALCSAISLHKIENLFYVIMTYTVTALLLVFLDVNLWVTEEMLMCITHCPRRECSCSPVWWLWSTWSWWLGWHQSRRSVVPRWGWELQRAPPAPLSPWSNGNLRKTTWLAWSLVDTRL